MRVTNINGNHMDQQYYEIIYDCLEAIQKTIWEKYQRLSLRIEPVGNALMTPYIPLLAPQYEDAAQRKNVIDGKLLWTNNNLQKLYRACMQEEPPSKDNITPANTMDELNYMGTILYSIGMRSNVRLNISKFSFNDGIDAAQIRKILSFYRDIVAYLNI